jgi:hypothetical protein
MFRSSKTGHFHGRVEKEGRREKRKGGKKYYK